MGATLSSILSGESNKEPKQTQPNDGGVESKSQGGGGNGQCGGGGEGQCGGGKKRNRRADHTISTISGKPVKFHVKTVMFRQSAYTPEAIRAWVGKHFPTKLRGMKLVSKPTGEYIHAILDRSTKYQVYRNKKINNDITIGLAK